MQETNPHKPSRVDTFSGVSPRLGIIGGGQLAKMTALAGLELGCDVVVLERKQYSPAANLASHSLIGDWDKPEDLAQLAESTDIVTLENEFVDANSLATLEQARYNLYPTSRCISLVQDKYIQKQTLAEAGLPVPAFQIVSTREDIPDIAAELGWPLVIKARRNAYDGKGNATVNNPDEINAAWEKLDGDNRELYAEAFCPFTMELAIIITTGSNGEVVSYPLVESVQRNHICHIVRAPAQVPDSLAVRASRIAREAVAAVGAIGSFGVEMFLTRDNEVIINELAPRVHNSGHYTIEACECSQFENHIRAVLGWPLGSTEMIKPAAVMINLLGQAEGSGEPIGIEDALRINGVHVHIYGKDKSNPGRKMGHVTAIGDSMDEVEERAQRAADAICFGENK